MMLPTASENFTKQAREYGSGSQHPKELATLVLALEVQGLLFTLQHLVSQLDGPLGIGNNEKLVTKLCITIERV